jgi:hypothetical protein
VHVPLRVGVDLDRQEQRRLALVHLLHRLRGVGVALRQLGQLLGELEQQLQAVLHPDAREVLHQLGELRGEGRLRGAHADPRSEPCTIGTRTELPHSVQLPS